MTAAATSSAVLLYINSIAEAIGTKENKHLSKVVEGEIENVHGGAPETILILGSDIRPEFGEEFGRSDTTILLRLDAEQNLISVLSIPRDLETEIPGYGTEKFNAAYAYGGPKLTVNFRGTERLEDNIRRAGRRLSLALTAGGALVATAITASSENVENWVPSALGAVGGLLTAGLVADLARRKG